MIINYISLISYSFIINGTVCGDVVPSRGLRQDDPISPYLSIFAAEAFSGLITKAVFMGPERVGMDPKSLICFFC